MEKKTEKKKEYQHWPEKATLQRLAMQLKKLRETEHLYSGTREID